MIDRAELLNDCKGLMRVLEEDLIARSHGDTALPEAVETLKEEFRKAKDAKRTAQNFEDWRTDYATQQAAAWVLSAVFVRFLEDNALIEPPQIAGPGDRLKLARDQHELYFRANPTETDREYLLHVFTEVGKLPGGREIFGKYNPVFEMPHWLSGDAAGEILRFFQKIDADSGELVHDFTDPEWDTRFLGDLYQDLSEAARKKFALLQTPEFVEEFILDRTLDPALDEFGLDAPAILNNDADPITEPGFRMIDPACGSGHFLLGAFHRILDRWQRKEPGTNVRELVQRTLNSVNGVDVNPYAIAIARFRLLIAALQACDVKKLNDAPAFHFSLTAGDSLLHGAPGVEQQLLSFDPLAHHYQSENIEELRRMLRSGAFHAVVANPPYITVKDKILNQEYRERYISCHRRYSLAVPFMERVYGLAVSGGYTGQITANSFMKREFGKRLVEEFIPTIDLTHMVDTSGAYIPGHGTPTVILFGKNSAPVSSKLRAVMGIQGEPGTPDSASNGLVWSSIVSRIDKPGTEDDFVSVDDSIRELFHTHPWSIGGGGAAELKEQLEQVSERELGAIATAIGPFQDTHADEAFVQPLGFSSRHRISGGFKKQVRGDEVRDWACACKEEILFPYDDRIEQWEEIPSTSCWSWLHALRTELWTRSTFGGGNYKLEGRPWFDYHQFPKDRMRTPLSIVFAFVATHNHFVLDWGGKILNRSAPVIKLAPDATAEDHFGLMGLLNSSIGCFWMKQIFHDKGSTVDARGARQTTVAFENFREFAGTGLKKFPVPGERPQALAKRIDHLAQSLEEHSPDATISQWAESENADLRFMLASANKETESIQKQMIALQEELDWKCYRLYELLDIELIVEKPPEIALGERAFEIALARKMVAGETQTTWFKRHGSTPITNIPEHWSDSYRATVEQRIELIATNKNIRLIEKPEYKRRWNSESWETRVESAVKQWLLSRLESYFDYDDRLGEHNPDGRSQNGWVAPLADVKLFSLAQVADKAQQDEAFQTVGAHYTNDPAFDALDLVTRLISDEAVPHIPVLRYKPSGLRKREEWEKTWALQRQEDAIDARTDLPTDDPNYLTKDQAERLKKHEVGDIPVPPKYKSSDFQKSHYWKLRGKLDVPKERWVSFPHCEGQDGTLMIAWAGYDHLQLARSISAHYVDVQERIGGRDDPRLVPLLASLIELLPWLKQWHNEIDPEFNMAMGDYFEGFIQEEARGLGMTLDEIRAWEPPKTTKRRAKRKKKATS